MLDNYPPGAANDPNAPYNQSDPTPVKVAVCISQSLSKSTTIKVTDYIAEKWEEVEADVDGPYVISGMDYDFSYSNLKGAYEEQEYTIPQLLYFLKVYLKEDIAGCPDNSGKKKRLQHILECCEGWNVDETEVVEE